MVNYLHELYYIQTNDIIPYSPFRVDTNSGYQFPGTHNYQNVDEEKYNNIQKNNTTQCTKNLYACL